MAHQSPPPPKNSMALSPARWKKAVSLGLQLADENKRVSRRLASLRKAEAKRLAEAKTTPTTPTSTDRPIIRVPHPSYQPTAKELREDLRLQGQFEDAVKALVRPVRVRQVMPPKPR